MHTKDLTKENVEKIAQLFPSCVTEAVSEDGSIRHLIDFEALKRQLSGATIPEGKERYVFSWPGKSEAQRLANTSSTSTLRPCRDKSIDFDSTKNIYIDGDNFEALKLLRETYLGKIKMIYIDPPYNTGNDFVYNDRFSMSKKDYVCMDGNYDDQGNCLVLNTIANGRFHTDWLNMIYPRVLLSKDFLEEDGTVFISINDYEITNLLKICEEIFGKDNVELMIWDKISGAENAGSGKMKITYRFRKDHEYIIVCYKNKQKTEFNKPLRTRKTKNEYGNPDNDPRGNWISSEICKSEDKSNPNGKNYYTITTPSGMQLSRQWHYSKEELDDLIADNRIYWGNGNIIPRLKKFTNEPAPVTPSSVINGISQTEGNRDLEALNLIFDNPKPIKLLKWLVEVGSNEDSLIMDFFSGSASIAQAILEVNLEQKSNRSFIIIQLPVEYKENSTEYKMGFMNISELARERIKRSSMKLTQQSTLDNLDYHLDSGFRTYCVDSSNMNDVFYDPYTLKKDLLDYAADNIKPDRSGEDLLFQVMLELGIELSAPIVKETMFGKEIYSVDGTYLIACFDNDIGDDVIIQIAKRKPCYAVFRDGSMASDSVITNFSEYFKTYSENTKTKVL